jgi:hypothetical protein
VWHPANGVRPIFTIEAKLFALTSSVSRSPRTAGSNTSTTQEAAAMFIAVGKVSLDDCDMLMSSFG